MTIHPHHPALAALIPLLPVIDIRAGSRHPLAWRGGDYLAELGAKVEECVTLWEEEGDGPGL